MGNKMKHGCSGVESYATCVKYELALPEFSNIEDDCYNLEETTEDLYILVGKIKEETDLSELGQSCLEYAQDAEGKTVVKNVLLKYEEEICTLKQEVEDLKSKSICELSIKDCELDLHGLTDECGDEIQTFGELLQILINQHNTAE